MSWIVSGAGLLLVLAAIRDIFHTVWHPEGFGSIANACFRLVWRFARRSKRPQRRAVAGPCGAALSVLAWSALIVVGWTVVYLPHMPDGFHFAPSLQVSSSAGVLPSLYLSLVTVATLGFGDIVPVDPLLRIVVPFQALVGFMLLTAAISWVLQVYSAIGRRRALAKRLSLLAATDASALLETGDIGAATSMLRMVTDGLVAVEIDLLQYAESYYFTQSDPALSLAANMPAAQRLARCAERSAHEEVRHAGRMLHLALHAVARLLDSRYLHVGGSDAEIMAAYAADKGHGSP